MNRHQIINTYAIKRAEEKSIRRAWFEFALWIVFILALSASMLGCSAAKVLFIQGECHPDEIVEIDGRLILSPNPCVTPRHP